MKMKGTRTRTSNLTGIIKPVKTEIFYCPSSVVIHWVCIVMIYIERIYIMYHDLILSDLIRSSYLIYDVIRSQPTNPSVYSQLTNQSSSAKEHPNECSDVF